MDNSGVRNAKGAGERFGLKFMINNLRYQRNKIKTLPFLVGVSNKDNIFEMSSIAKEVKPGFVTTYSVEPVEAIATEELHEVEKEARKCYFHDETMDEFSKFVNYSQSTCEFECRLNFARKVCRCTPWHFPTPVNGSEPEICDLYGNTCFSKMMSIKMAEIKDCNCMADCETVRFSINEKEALIDYATICGSHYNHKV